MISTMPRGADTSLYWGKKYKNGTSLLCRIPAPDHDNRNDIMHFPFVAIRSKQENVPLVMPNRGGNCCCRDPVRGDRQDIPE